MVYVEAWRFLDRMSPILAMMAFFCMLIALAEAADRLGEIRRRKLGASDTGRRSVAPESVPGVTWEDIEAAIDQGCCVTADMLPDGPAPPWATSGGDVAMRAWWSAMVAGPTG